MYKIRDNNNFAFIFIAGEGGILTQYIPDSSVNDAKIETVLDTWCSDDGANLIEILE